MRLSGTAEAEALNLSGIGERISPNRNDRPMHGETATDMYAI